MLISGKDIIEKNILTEINLLYYIDREEITALNDNSFKPIDWKSLKADFKEIQSTSEGVPTMPPPPIWPNWFMPVIRLPFVKREVDDGQREVVRVVTSELHEITK